MTKVDNLKLLFIVNPVSGSNTVDWTEIISNYFNVLNHTVEFYILTKICKVETIKEKIKLFAPHQVIAVGGDGTIKLVAESIIGTNILLGIIPAGSANGLAKELGISDNPQKAMDLLIEGYSKKIHITMINNHLCIHLSDIGLNAYAMKKFTTQSGRGMWGYFMASLKVLWQNPKIVVDMKIDNKIIEIEAAMIVIANATKYGTGVVINPIGNLEDDVFEVIAIKKVSIREVFKMVFSRNAHESDEIEVFQTNALTIRSAKRVHFQVDGEYLGKVKQVEAVLVPEALHIIVPETTTPPSVFSLF